MKSHDDFYAVEDWELMGADDWLIVSQITSAQLGEELK